MSYVLELAIPVATWDEAERIAAATTAPGCLPLLVGKRRGWVRSRPPSVHVEWDAADEVLDDSADFDDDPFPLSPVGREALARTILRLSEVVAPGWSLRSYWVGDPVEREVTVAPAELADLVRGSALRRTTLYLVG